MYDDFDVAFVTPTPEDVLAIFREQQRQAATFHCTVDPSIDLTFETTIHQWRMACDLLDWRPLGRSLNEWWHIAERRKSWRRVLEPPKKRTLRDVCEFLAPRIKVPRAQPIDVLGRECRPAGAFLAMRSLLKHAGADVSDVAPSTPLAEYTRRYTQVFWRMLELAPGALPPVNVKSWLSNVADVVLLPIVAGAFGGGFLWWLVGGIWSSVTTVIVFVGVLCYIGTWIASPWILPDEVTFGELRTFRDMSVAIARDVSR